ncbi:hypothetical protein [Niveibacterium sp. COAC-50]|uniref:hypothetical protein n=1 Tax=Niveibacterium sp. COAC-50 TaxID=2729384 RepID=UPI001557EC3F|nr:hypothetical protein [Niveibacterium sp. COAC-50]
MTDEIDWLAVEQDVLARLKPFQRDTVEWAFECLFPADGRPCSGRFLVADEVGLGKTLVARGVLAKTLRHLQGKVGRVDVVYICSNADIAQQNIRRLSIPALERVGFRSQGRLTLMPLIPLGKDGRPERPSALPHSGVNFQALTPGTSLDFRNDPGHAQERALLAQMVTDVLPEVSMTRWRNLFAQQVGHERFETLMDRVRTRYAIDDQLQKLFSEELRRGDQDGRTLVSQLAELADRFPRQRAYRHRDPDQREAATLIANLRRTLAGVCIQALEPDLLILDEFQRFPRLLDSHDPNAELARQLYEYETDGQRTRVLMLSATPYRMSSVGDAPEEDSHHDEFLAMVRFLLRDDETALARLRDLLERFNDGLRTLDPADTTAIEALRDQIEALLRGVMSRTDRTPTSQERDAMVLAPPTPVHPDAAQMYAYVGLKRVGVALQVPDLLEYWRSAPAAFSFLSGYKLRDKLIEALVEQKEGLCTALATPGLFLDAEGAVGAESGHARTAAMARALIEAGLHRVAWLPPSLPGHVLGGPFATLGDCGRTKRLLFSSWRMVPRAVSTVLDGLLSAEQRREFGPPPARRHEETYGDYLLGYPSAVLANLGHPDRWAADCEADGVTPTVPVLIDRLMPALTRLMEEVQTHYGSEAQGAEDHDWYWLGPALADSLAWEREYGGEAREAFRPFEFESLEAERDGDPLWARDGIAARQSLWDALRRGDARLGKRPADLIPVLCHLALAGPAVCALRALADEPSQHWDEVHRQTASGVAAALLHYLGHEQTVQMLTGLYPEERSFATRLLRHAADGGLQAVLDEYLAVLDVDQPLGPDMPAGSLAALAARLTQMEVALRLKPAVLRPEVMRQDENGAWRLVPLARSLRFARPLLEDSSDGDEGDGPTAMTQLRAAFNSPFLPFVLSSTSIGQEGLDFHWYSHAIVHWNLPSSPVDFEQRDGRIHRFRNHAVRRNLARDWGGAALVHAPGRLAWNWMFDQATAFVAAKGEDAGGMRPSWIYREGDSSAPKGTPSWMLAAMGQPARIERLVPVIPHSRDQVGLGRMMKAVGRYRMVFAQPRQEDLLAHLERQCSDESLEALAESILIDLRPPNRA